MYYVDYSNGNNNVVKANLDGNNKVIIAKDNDEVNVYVHMWVMGDWIYLLRWNWDARMLNLYRIKTDGSKEELVIDREITSLDIRCGRIYFTLDNDDKVYSVKMDGTDLRLLN